MTSPTATSPARPPPAKRVKLDEAAADATIPQTATATLSQIDLERAVGITEYIDASAAVWNGILKQRYTDFLVNEIDEAGKVVHLTSLEWGGRGGAKREKRVEKKSKEDEEVGEDGVKVKVKEDEVPTPVPVAAPEPEPVKEFELSPSDAAELTSLTTPEITTFCTTLHRTLLTSPTPLPQTSITTPHIPSKSSRSTLHALVRRLFSSTLETQTLTGDHDGHIRIQPATPSSRNPTPRGNNTTTKRGNRGGKNQKNPTEKLNALGGEYCHFLLYKENRDTMQAVGLLGRLLRTGKAKNVITFAGTKDRRAVTVQRCSALRIRAERLAALNEGGANGLHAGTRVGNFEYKPYGLELGDLGGNEFCITLRECSVIGGGGGGGGELETVVREGVERVRERGFVNYFGLQRFGSFTVGTWEVGYQLLLGSWRTAVEKILDYDAALLGPAAADGGSSSTNADDRARAEACALFATTHDIARPAEMVPRKFIAESTILRYISSRGNTGDGEGGGLDYLGALQAVPRTLRSMYTHAYQSYVWNHVVSARVRMGLVVLPGDLVLIEADAGGKAEAVEVAAAAAAAAVVVVVGEEEVDQDGEVVVTVPVEKSTSGRPREGEEFARARPLSKEEAESGRWTMRDVVLPTPGWDVVYPENELMEVYKSVMKAHGLDPMDMKRSNREYSLPGGYRKILAGFLDGGCTYEVRAYRGLEQVVSTDMEVLERKKAGEGEEKAGEADGGKTEEAGDKMEIDGTGEEEEKMAVVLRLKLGTSTYATMALRELMREGIRAYKPEFSR